MSGVSDAAAIVWAVKSNMDSSACMDNQMKMYRKGVLDGKDKDTAIDEDWGTDDTAFDVSIDITDNENIPDQTADPAIINLTDGVTMRFLKGGGDSDNAEDYQYVRIWANPNEWGDSVGGAYGTTYQKGVVHGEIHDAYGNCTSKSWMYYYYGSPRIKGMIEYYEEYGRKTYRNELSKLKITYIPSRHMVEVMGCYKYFRNNVFSEYMWGDYSRGVCGGPLYLYLDQGVTYLGSSTVLPQYLQSEEN